MLPQFSAWTPWNSTEFSLNIEVLLFNSFHINHNKYNFQVCLNQNKHISSSPLQAIEILRVTAWYFKLIQGKIYLMVKDLSFPGRNILSWGRAKLQQPLIHQPSSLKWVYDRVALLHLRFIFYKETFLEVGDKTCILNIVYKRTQYVLTIAKDMWRNKVCKSEIENIFFENV